MVVHILDDDGNPVSENDFAKWTEWKETHDCSIMRSIIGDVKILTVFLGIDHDLKHEGFPVLFETMVFGGFHDGFVQTYSTRQDAEKGHNEIVFRIES